jgi:transposase InsO family protein
MPMKNIREEAVIDAFNKLYEASKKLIPMKRVVTDEGSEFVSNAVKRWMTEKGVAHRILEPTYHY